MQPNPSNALKSTEIGVGEQKKEFSEPIDIYAVYCVRLLKDCDYGNKDEIVQMLGSEWANVLINELGEREN